MSRERRNLSAASLFAVVLPIVITACSSAAAPYSYGSNDGSAGSGGGGGSAGSGADNTAGSDDGPAAGESGAGGAGAAGNESGSVPTPTGSCCEAHDSAGCESQNVMSCVCSTSPSCCTEAWTAACASLAAKSCTTCDTGEAGSAGEGGSAGEAGSGGAEPFGGASGSSDSGGSEPFGGSSGAEPGGTCCKANYYPGCSSTTVEACVCAEDAYCCSVEWDSSCADEVIELGCGTCNGSGSGSSGNGCCDPYAGYCNSSYIRGCVCEYDYYCCAYEWDEGCADEVEALGCGYCD